jgi:hypothetical protein
MRAHNSRLTSQSYSSLVKWPPVEIGPSQRQRERERNIVQERWCLHQAKIQKKKELKTRARAKSRSGDKTFFRISVSDRQSITQVENLSSFSCLKPRLAFSHGSSLCNQRVVFPPPFFSSYSDAIIHHQIEEEEGGGGGLGIKRNGTATTR